MAVEKIPDSTCGYRPIYFKDKDVFNKKLYKFEEVRKMNRHFENTILVIDYSRVFVYDLEQPNHKPQCLETQCEYEELKAAPVIFLSESNKLEKHFRNDFWRKIQNGIKMESCLC
jgi:hypothetical protein